MAWKKNSPQAVRRFEELAALPGAKKAVMFGCPVYALQDHRYAMLHQDRVVLRLSPKDAARLIAEGGKVWEPFKGRPMQGRIVVPTAIAESTRSLRAWIRRAAKSGLSP